MPLTVLIARRSVELDLPPKDPADRLICATSLGHKLPLITHVREMTRGDGEPFVWWQPPCHSRSAQPKVASVAPIF